MVKLMLYYQKNTLLSPEKLHVLKLVCLKVVNLLGSVALLGCWRCGTSLLISDIHSKKHIYLFDTFQGIPLKGLYDRHNVGDFSDVDIEDINNRFRYKNASFYKGIFPETVDDKVLDLQFCFIHVDMDQYSATVSAIKTFYPLLVLNGVMLFDDFMWEACPGIHKALELSNYLYIQVSNNQAVIIKGLK